MPIIERNIIQGSDLWFHRKIGKPSASNASRLITSKGVVSKSLQGYAEEMAGDAFAKQAVNQWSGNSYTDYGTEKEDEARLSYELETGLEVEQVAFIEDDLLRVIVSPDGLTNGADGNGLVEIKNKPKLHISSLLYYAKHGNPPTDYIAQIQMQLLVSEYDFCDLYYYSLLLPKLRIRIYPDKHLFAALKSTITAAISRRDEILNILRSME